MFDLNDKVQEFIIQVLMSADDLPELSVVEKSIETNCFDHYNYVARFLVEPSVADRDLYCDYIHRYDNFESIYHELAASNEEFWTVNMERIVNNLPDEHRKNYWVRILQLLDEHGY